MSLLISPIFYAPPLSYYLLFNEHQTVIFDAKQNYLKSTWRNQCEIATANGKLMLSIPLKKGKHQQRSLECVEISNEHPWQKLHWQSLKSAYQRSAYFEYFEDELYPFYHTQYHLLTDFTWALHLWIVNKLTLKYDFEFSKEFNKNYGDANTDLRFNYEYKNSNEQYWQVFQEKTGFIEGVSILDALFCRGKNNLL